MFILKPMNQIKEESIALVIDNVNRHDSKNSDDSTDDNRKELLWERREEIVIEEWRNQCLKNSTAHGKAGKAMKSRYVMLSLPSMIIPMVAGGLSSVLTPFPLVSGATMIVTSILTGTNSFFDFGGKKEQHFHYESAYMELANEIQKEMAKPKPMRPACDVFMERVVNRLNELNRTAPLL